MGEITKAPIGAEDFNNWDGVTSTFNRDTSTGGEITLRKVGYEVDALIVYGGGVNYTSATINSALTTIGTTNKVTLLLRPGSWAIATAQDWSAYKNVTIKCPPGAYFTKSGTGSIAFGGPFESGPYQVFSGFDAGDVTFGLGSLKEGPHGEWWGINGTADDIEIQCAVASISAGEVILSQNYATTGTITGKSGVTLKRTGGTITYSGSGDAIQIPSSAWAKVSGVFVTCTHASANAIRVVGGGRYWTIEKSFLYTSNVSSTGAGIKLDSQAAAGWIGTSNIEHNYVLGFKYGIGFFGAGGSDIITTIFMRANILVGLSSGVIAGSAGLYLDAGSGGSGSQFLGGDIEYFASGVKTENGAIFGGEIYSSFENNTANTSLGNSFNGSVYINGQASPNVRMLNTTTLRFMKEQDIAGQYYKETRYDQKHVIYNADVKRTWGVYFGTTGFVDGGSPVFRGGVELSSSPAAYWNNRLRLLNYHIAWHSGAPTEGSWTKGDVIWNTAPASGGATPNGWRCITSGTFSAYAQTGDTDGSTAVITNVSSMSGIVVDDYVSVAAGFPATGPYRVIATTATTMTLDTNSNSAQVGTAITTPDPTFASMGVLP